MNKKTLYTVVSVSICLLVIIFGNRFYNSKIQATHVEAQEQSEIEAKEKRQAEEAKKAEEKRIYEKNKGEKLVYSPMGDSLALGLHATEENKKYTSVLSSLIESKLGYDVVLKDGAVEGGKGLVDKGIPDLPDVIEEDPDLVTIEFGTNDSDESRESYSSPEDFKSKLETVIDTLRESDETPPEIVLVTTWNHGERSYEYDEIIHTVGKEKDVPVANIQPVWVYRTDTFGPIGYKDMFGNESDGWHPNDRGHAEIAKTIFDETSDLLK